MVIVFTACNNIHNLIRLLFKKTHKLAIFNSFTKWSFAVGSGNVSEKKETEKYVIQIYNALL